MGRKLSRTLVVLPSAEVLLALGLGLALGLVLALGSALAAPDGGSAELERRANRTLVREFGLTDLALWPGASYTRHPSQADRFAPFSDHPAALERWPAGSVVPPPQPPNRGRRP